MKKWKSRNFYNSIFLKFPRKLPVTFNLTLIEQIDNWLYFQGWFSINFVWKIPSLPRNERMHYFQKKTSKIRPAKPQPGIEISIGVIVETIIEISIEAIIEIIMGIIIEIFIEVSFESIIQSLLKLILKST